MHAIKTTATALSMLLLFQQISFAAQDTLMLRRTKLREHQSQGARLAVASMLPGESGAWLAGPEKKKILWENVQPAKIPLPEKDRVLLFQRWTQLNGWESMEYWDLRLFKTFVEKARAEGNTDAFELINDEVIDLSFRSNEGFQNLVKRAHPYTVSALRTSKGYVGRAALHEATYYRLFARRLLGDLPTEGIVVVNRDTHDDAKHYVDDRGSLNLQANGALILKGVSDYNWAGAAVRDGLAKAVITVLSNGKYVEIIKRVDGSIVLNQSDDFPHSYTTAEMTSVFLTVDLDSFSLDIPSASNDWHLDAFQIRDNLLYLFEHLDFFRLRPDAMDIAVSHSYLHKRANAVWIDSTSNLVQDLYGEHYAVSIDRQMRSGLSAKLIKFAGARLARTEPTVRSFLLAAGVLVAATGVFLMYFQNQPFIIFRPLSTVIGHVAAGFIQRESSARQYAYRYTLAGLGSFLTTPVVEYYLEHLKAMPTSVWTDHWLKAGLDLFLWSHLATLPTFVFLAIKDMKPMPWKAWIQEYKGQVWSKLKIYFGPGGFFKINVFYWMPIAIYNYRQAGTMGEIHTILIVASMLYTLPLAFHSAKNDLGDPMNRPPFLEAFLKYVYWVPTAVTGAWLVYGLFSADSGVVTAAAGMLITTFVAVQMIELFFWTNKKVAPVLETVLVKKPAGARLASSSAVREVFSPVVSSARLAVLDDDFNISIVKALKAPVLSVKPVLVRFPFLLASQAARSV